MPQNQGPSAKKRNAYSIRSQVSAAIFKEFREQQCGDALKGTVFASFNMPLLSSIANLATRGLMKDPKLNIVLRKGRL